MNNKDILITQEIPRIWSLPPRNQAQRPVYFFIIQHCCKEDTNRLKLRGQKKIYHTKSNQNRAEEVNKLIDLSKDQNKPLSERPKYNGKLISGKYII